MQETATLTSNQADYTVARDPSHPTKWAVFCLGQVVADYITRKRDATAKTVSLCESQAYRERILSNDETGHVWTAEESEHIADYAVRLASNAVFGFAKRTWADKGRSQHYSEIHTIQSHYAFGPPSHWGMLICAEIRRQRAARTLAFIRAGLTLEQGYWELVCKRVAHPEDDPRSHVIPCATEAECKAQLARLQNDPEYKPDRYTEAIVYVPASFPIVCKFASYTAK